MFEVDEVLLGQYKKSVDIQAMPREFQRWFNSASDDEKEEWFRQRFKCLKYHLYLSGYVESKKPDDDFLPPTYEPILGMDFQENPHSVLFQQFIQKRPGEHIVYSDLQTLTKKMMILWPRGLFKTSSIIVEIVQTILNYPNIRICFLTGGDKLAKRQLARVKRVFEKPTKRFRFLFPEFCLKDIRNRKIEDESDARAWITVQPRMGDQHEFTVPCRTQDMFAEPTFAISTAKSVKAGSHYDLIIIDDLVNEQNFRSPTRLEKCYQDYLDICPVLDPSGSMIVTGTRYSFGDTYERIQEKAKEEEKEIGKTIWRFSIRNCWSYGCRNCKHSDVFHNTETNIVQPPCGHAGCDCKGYQSDGVKGVLFPLARSVDGRSIGHTLEFLEGERLRLGLEFFANQYENNPIAAGTQTFTSELLDQQTLHHENQLPGYHESFTFLVGDLAYVGQEDRDFSVIFILRKFRGQIFLVGCEYGHWDSGVIAERTIGLVMRHRPGAIYYEKFNGSDAYDRVIQAYAKSVGLEKVLIEWLPCKNTPKAKLARIGAVKGPMQNRRVWLYSPMNGYLILRNQLEKWPKLGKNDDFSDTLGLALEAPTGYELETPPPPKGDPNWLHRLNPHASVEPTEPDCGGGSGISCGPPDEPGWK